ncbi:MAG: YdeI/OmpD-associated family protein [Taibaiella sp.]|nr:YdeI/OmpD-associated family protein [Taibaiella sp.]
MPTLAFATADAWEQWLAANHARSDGIWMRIFKKDSGAETVTYAEALDDALCYGWIDGQKKKFDSESWIQKFTPRRARSIWSKRNIEHIERLTKEKRMRASGLKAFEDARKDGRLAAAYDSPANSSTPDDLLKLLETKPKAKAFFDSLNKVNKYAITWRLQSAKKPETREKRMNIILDMLEKGEKFH